MSARENVLTIEGNLTRDPEMTFTPSGKGVVKFGIAYNERYLDPQSGQWKDGQPTFVDIECWNGLAEAVAESLSKGDRAIVVGRLKLDQWTTPEGDKRSKLKVTADSVGRSLRFAASKGTAQPNGEGRAVEPGEYDEEPF